MATVTLRLTPQRAHVRTARLVAVAMARRSGVAEELLDEVRLAVGEACGRAVQLHERYGLTEPVVVTLADDDDRFKVVVRDLAPSKPEGDDALRHPANPAASSRDCGPGYDPATPVEPAASGASAPGATAPEPAGPDPGGPDPAAGGSPAAAGGTGRDAVGVPGWLAPHDAGLNLVLLEALVEDFAIKTADGVVGTEVAMSWSIGQPPAGSGRVGGRPVDTRA
jgi:anti-sigma regulatory factor (Ser/Thr protein kinase)